MNFPMLFYWGLTIYIVLGPVRGPLFASFKLQSMQSWLLFCSTLVVPFSSELFWYNSLLSVQSWFFSGLFVLASRFGLFLIYILFFPSSPGFFSGLSGFMTQFLALLAYPSFSSIPVFFSGLQYVGSFGLKYPFHIIWLHFWPMWLVFSYGLFQGWAPPSFPFRTFCSFPFSKRTQRSFPFFF